MKEEFYQAANGWWRRKLAEIGTPAIDPEKQAAMNDIERKIRYAASHAPNLIADLGVAKGRLEGAAPGDLGVADQSEIEQNIEVARLMGISVPDDLDPLIAQHLFGERRI